MDKQTKMQLQRKDRQFVWHPFTQMKDYAEQDHLLIERAEGIYLYDADGKQYYDTISSWWVNLHGHGHPRIRKAITRQMEQMDHVMFSGLTHRPGIELAEKLVEITPIGLDKVFYSDNGSTAVEVALKMSFQYWQQVGRTTKTEFVYMDHSYHGDTIGAVSVGGVDMFHAMFKPLLFTAHKVPCPDPGEWGDSPEAGVAACLAALEQRFDLSGGSIAAMIVEPMIQAAGGMILYPAAYLLGVRELCTRYGVHLIADEVAVGFGRTGEMFGCNHAGISPDLMCLSKGLTAGVVPLAATLCSEEIYQAFYDDHHSGKAFLHGHSFTGNPVAAAVALESLSIFEDERVLEHVREAAAHLKGQMAAQFGHLDHVGGVRSLGMVGAFDLYADKTNKTQYPPTERMGEQIFQEGLKEGLILRPLGDTLYYWLPLCTTTIQITDIIERTIRVLQRIKW